MSEQGEMLFEGIASSTSIDSFHTIFNRQCQEGFRFDIVRGMESGEPVELEAEHMGEDEPMNILGALTSAEVIDGDKLKVVARLDHDNPKAVYYYRKMTVPDSITGKTKQFGLSINGMVQDAHFEYNDELMKNVRVFDRVILKRVGIVRKPSNPDSWVEKIIRSVQWEDIQTTERSESQMLEKENEVLDAAQEEVTLTEPEVVREDAVVQVGTEQEEATEAPDEMANLLKMVSDLVMTLDKLEDMTEMDKGEEVMDAMRACMGRMDSFVSKRAADTSNSAVSMNEDLSDEKMLTTAGTQRSEEADAQEEAKDEDMQEEVQVEQEQEVEAVEVEAEEAPEAPEAEVVAERTEKDDLLAAVADILDDRLSVLRGSLEEIVSENKALRSELSEMKKANDELVERVARVESEPAVRPGAQLIEEVVRGDSNASKRQENIQRAQKANDTRELIKLKLLGDKYLGYGEFA